MQRGLTCSTLLDLRSNGEDIQYLNHHLYEHPRQFGVQEASRINLEALEEVLHALKEIEEHIMARAHIPCCLSTSVLECAQKRRAGYRRRGEYQYQ